MSSWQERYLDRFYYSSANWRSLTDYWQAALDECVEPGATVLEIGPGPHAYPSLYLAKRAGRLVGVDVDPKIVQNSALAEAHVYGGVTLPFADATFDAVVSRWVNEHLADPESHCAEVYRVLKPGGRYAFRTPNAFHYVSLISRLTPHSFHVTVAAKLRNYSDAADDPYPTYYRLNTRRRIRSTLSKRGFRVHRLDIYETYPGYGLASRSMFWALMLYERLVNATKVLEGLRHTIDCVAVKPSR